MDLTCSSKENYNSKNNHHIVHPLSGAPVNCLITVDNVIRATTDFGTPHKISLSPTISSQWNDGKDDLLEPLQNTRHLFIREYKKPLQFSSMKAKKKYQIINSCGDCIFYAVETPSFLRHICFLRNWCSYKINVMTLSGDNVLEFSRGAGSNAILTVKDSQDQVLGYIKKLKNPCTPSYSIMTPVQQEMLKIKGPEGSSCCCTWADCGSDDFDIKLPDGETSIGKVSTEWEYVLEDLCGVFVPMKLDEGTMSLCLGLLFLLNFNFYQGRKDASCFGRCFMTLIFFTLFVLLLFFISKK